MTLNVSMDTRQFERMTAAVLKQIPYAASQALNDTAKQFQAIQRQHVMRAMTVRQRTYILNSIKIDRHEFASRGNLKATVKIDPHRDELAKHEQGGEKYSISGRPYVAVPTSEIRRTKRGLVPRSMYPSAFKPFTTRGGKTTGQKRTFIIPTQQGNRLLLQRTGRNQGVGQQRTRDQRTGRFTPFAARRRARSSLRALYLFVPSVTLQPALEFVENAHEVARASLPANFRLRLAAAIRTARV